MLASKPSSMNTETAKTIYLDLETSGLDPDVDKITLMGARVEGQSSVTESELKEYLADPNNTLVGHNIKFDVAFLVRAGYVVKCKLFDTKVLAYSYDPFRSLSLEDLAEQVLKVKHISFDSQPTKKKDLDPAKTYTKIGRHYVSDDVLLAKNTEDIELSHKLSKSIPQTDWFKKVERPLTDILADMETRGITIDQDQLRKLGDEVESELIRLEKEIKLVVPCLNINSGEQLSAGLLAIKMPLSRYSESTVKGFWSVDSQVLRKLDWDGHSICGTILEYRKLKKLKSTYIDPILVKSGKDGKLHGFFNQAGKTVSAGDNMGTRTGRLSSSDPNLQNIPARSKEGLKIREAFIASEGFYLIDSDLKQIEPRYVAHLTQSPKLIKAFATGQDTHAMFAADIFGKKPEELTKMERFIGKSSWLATVYGCYPDKLKETCEKFSETRLTYDLDFYKEVQKNFWDKNPEISAWRRCHIESTRRTGYITTYGGRIIKIPNINSKREWERNQAERWAVNYVVQSSCADIMKMIMLSIAKDPKFRMLAVVHDEILAEVDGSLSTADAKISLDYYMTQFKLKNVNIECDTKVVRNWAEAK